MVIRKTTATEEPRAPCVLALAGRACPDADLVPGRGKAQAGAAVPGGAWKDQSARGLVRSLGRWKDDLGTELRKGPGQGAAQAPAAILPFHPDPARPPFPSFF